MDFLSKITAHSRRIFSKIFAKKRTESFEEMVRKEKKQKYLFTENTQKNTLSSRSKKRGFFGKSIKKNGANSSPNAITRFLGEHIHDQDLRYIMGGIGVLLLSLSTYLIVFSPYFKISPNQILIEPLTDGIDMSIAYRSLESIYGESIFLLDEKNIATNLKKNLENIENVHIDRLFPNGVKVLIRSLAIPYEGSIYGVDNKRFGISSNGVLIPMQDLKNANFVYQLEVISDELKSEIFLGYKKIISDQNMFLISKILDVFHLEWNDLIVARIRYYSLESEIHIILESNTKILLALQDEEETAYGTVPNQILQELVTLNTYIMKNRSSILDGSLEYIDARIPGKIFLCKTGAQCRNNLNLIYQNTYQ